MSLLKYLKHPLMLVLISVLLVLTLITRFYAIDIAPAGGDADTAWMSIDAMDWLLRGAWPYYVDATHMPSPLVIVLLGVAIKIHGVALETPRLVTAMSSVLTVLFLLPCAWTLLADDKPERRLLAGLGAMAAAATSMEAMNVARLGVNSPLLALMVLLSLWSAAWAWHKGGKWRWILAGIALGSSQYIYISGHLMALVAILWFLHSAIANPALLRKHWRGWILMAFVAFIVVLPNLILYLTWPESFTQRLDAASNPGVGGFVWNYDFSSQGGLLMFLLRKLWNSFIVVGISWTNTYLVGDTPVLTPLFFIAWIIGAFVALWRFRRMAYGWVLLAVFSLILADLLTSTNINPHAMRQIGLLPLHYLLAGYGIAEIVLLLLVLPKLLRNFALTLMLVVAIAPTVWSFYYYLTVEIPEIYADPKTSWYINLTDVNISDRINAAPEQSYLLSYGEYTRFNTAWLTMQSFPDRHSILQVDGSLRIDNLPTELVVIMPTEPNRARHDLGVELDSTRWWVLLHEGQALLMPPLSLEQETELLSAIDAGQVESLIDASGLHIANFVRIPSPDALFVPQEFVPVDATFALEGSAIPELRLLGYVAQAIDPIPGGEMEISLYWETLSPLSRNYELAVQLWDDSSRSYANDHGLPYRSTYRTRIWQTDEITVTHHMLFLSDDMPTGRYSLTIQVVRLLENSSLRVTGADALPTGEGAWARDMRILPDLEISSLRPMNETVLLGDILELSGMELYMDKQAIQAFDTLEVRGGEIFDVRAQWDVLQNLEADYSFFVHLIPTDEIQPIAQGDIALGSSSLPSGAWRSGDQWQEGLSFSVPENIPVGEYNIWLGVYDYRDGSRLPVIFEGDLQADNRLLIGRMLVAAP